jgi:hypothetical protein
MKPNVASAGSRRHIARTKEFFQPGRHLVFTYRTCSMVMPSSVRNAWSDCEKATCAVGSSALRVIQMMVRLRHDTKSSRNAVPSVCDQPTPPAPRRRQPVTGDAVHQKSHTIQHKHQSACSQGRSTAVCSDTLDLLRPQWPERASSVSAPLINSVPYPQPHPAGGDRQT